MTGAHAHRRSGARAAIAVIATVPVCVGASVRLPFQQPQTSCQIQVDSAAVRAPHGVRRITGDDGMLTLYAGGGVWARCLNDSTTIYADSMYYVQTTQNLQLVGAVNFRDSISTLEADHVTYFLRQERLVARGNVYTRNLRNGSDLRGPHLDYARVVPPIRDTMELYATGRPTITFYPQSDSTRPAAERPLPFIIIGDRVRMRHSNQMWGSGNVTINRPDLAARADSAVLNLRDSLGVLIGAPVITGYDSVSADSVAYRLTGQRIDFALTTRNEVRRVLSQGDAVANGRDWRLTADTLDMAVDSGRIERAQAWGDHTRPVAVSGLSTIVADSMDIRMPGQKMQLVWAWGSARATSRPDTTAPADDWLVGDSLRADFAERPMPEDSTRLRTEIAQVISYGHARAYYHVANDADSAGQRGINYSRGDRITIAMTRRRVRTVDIVGQVDGVYLEPLPPRPDTSARDTTARDTTARDTASVRLSAGAPVRPSKP